MIFVQNANINTCILLDYRDLTIDLFILPSQEISYMEFIGLLTQLVPEEFLMESSLYLPQLLEQSIIDSQKILQQLGKIVKKSDLCLV